MRLLLVEDDPMIGASVQNGTRQEGYAVDWVRDGQAAELALEGDAHAMVLLDLGLPRKSGLDVLTALRRKKVDIPVLILTARDSVADCVRGLDAGADDYLVKPFDLDELAARIRAVLRRRSGRAATSSRRVAANPFSTNSSRAAAVSSEGRASLRRRQRNSLTG